MSAFDIVCCSLEDWDDVWRRNQYLVRELLALEPSGRVLFVEPPNDITHGLRHGRWTRRRSGLRRVDGVANLWALKPDKWLPRVAGGGADRHLASQVGRAVRVLGFERPLLWVNDAAYATLADRVAWPCVYDITDDWLLADALPRERRRRETREAFLLERSEEVVVCSPALSASRSRHRPVRLIPNAVDAQRYQAPQPRPDDLPSSPVAVYVGTLHRDRLDVELVVRAATATPGMQFAFVGPLALDDADLAALRRAPNVHLLGPRPSEAVPAYLQHASVLIVPHVVNPFTESLDPIKAYEYTATGRPVVSTPVAGFRDLASEQVTCVNPDGFAGAVAAMGAAGRSFPPATPASWAERAAAFRDALVEASDAAAAKPLRVVYLDHSAKLSGAELALARLVPALAHVDPVVVLAEPGPLQDRLDREGIRTEVLALDPRTQSLRRDRLQAGRLPVAALWQSVRHVAALRRRIVELRPDLVHTNSLKAAVYGSIAGRLAGVPVVVHVRDRIAPDYLPGPAVALVRSLLRHLPAALIANSEATRATVRSRRPKPVIHDIVQPPGAVVHREDGGYCVGMVGRLAPWKGQHVFLDAFAAAFAASDEYALIVGSALFGEDDYAESLREQARQLAIADRVEFVGFVDDVYAQLARMDVLVHASVIAEPFGQVVIEAMAAHVPVVASAAGGPLEVIDHGVTGMLVPPGDAAALAAALRTLRDDADLRTRLADAAQRSVGRFAPEEIARQVEAVYTLVTCGRHQTSRSR